VESGEEIGVTPAGQPAVDSGSERPELLDKAREKKKSVALVTIRAREFLESVRDRTLARLKREELYRQAVEVVFAYWAARLHHPGALLDRKRENRLLARLRESGGDWGMLCYVIDGALRDDWIMGRKPDSERSYDGIETLFRDRAQVERLAELCPAFRAGEPHQLVVKYAPNGNGHE